MCISRIVELLNNIDEERERAGEGCAPEARLPFLMADGTVDASVGSVLRQRSNQSVGRTTISRAIRFPILLLKKKHIILR